MKLRTLVLAAVAMSISACSTISSNHFADGQKPREGSDRGVPYFLPKGMVRVSIVLTEQDEFRVVVAAPIMVPDRDYLLQADLRHGAFSDDVTVFKVDPKTSLLTSADVTSTGRASELAENLVKAFGMIQASEGTGGQTIFSGLYEFSKLEDASNDASAALKKFVALKCSNFGNLSDEIFENFKKVNNLTDKESSDELKISLNQCRLFAISNINTDDLVKLSLLDQNDTFNSTQVDLSRCRRGVCYRPMRPVGIKTEIAGTFRQDDVFMIPDTSRVAHFALPAGAFANQRYQLKFDQGALIEVTSDTKSELVGFSTLPIKLITAIISAPGAALGLKSAALKSQDDYLTAVEAHSAKVAKSREACLKEPESCPDTALKILKIDASPRRKGLTSGDRGATDSVPTTGAPSTATEGNGPVSTGGQ